MEWILIESLKFRSKSHIRQVVLKYLWIVDTWWYIICCRLPLKFINKQIKNENIFKYLKSNNYLLIKFLISSHYIVGITYTCFFLSKISYENYIFFIIRYTYALNFI